MDAKHTPMVVAAARVLCRRAAEACGIDADDNWKQYGDDYLQDAQAAIDASGAPEVLAALGGLLQIAQRCFALTASEEQQKVAAMDKARAAFAKATGGAS